MTQLLTILALVLTVTTAFAQTSKSVTYSDSTRKMGPQDLLIKAQGVTTTVGITNEAVTANTVAVFGASKELKSAALVNLTFDGTTLTASGGGSGGNWTALGTTNSTLPGDAIAYNYKGVLAPELSGTTWNVDVGTYAYRGAISGDTTMTFSGETSSNAWETEVLILGNGTNTLTLSGANFTVLGGTPDIVPAGVQRLRVTPFGGTNYVSCAWRPISNVDGFMKQSTNGPVIDTTDYAGQIAENSDDIAAILASPGTGYILEFRGPSTLAWADNTTNYIGKSIGGSVSVNRFPSGFTNQSLPFPKTGSIKAVFLNIMCGVGSAEAVSAYIDINNGSTLIPISTTIDMSVDNNNVLVTDLNQSVNGGATPDWVAIRIVTPTWATDPSGDRAYGWIYIE